MMNLREFVQTCYDDSLEWFPDSTQDLTIHTLGLVGEAGEFADVVKKVQRGSLEFDADARNLLCYELVDVLIYVGNLAALLRLDLEEAYLVKREYNYERFGEGSTGDGSSSEGAREQRLTLPSDYGRGDQASRQEE